LSWYHRASPAKRQQSLRAAMLYGIGITLLLLVVTGRIPWLFALFSAAVPWINRAMAARRLWSNFQQQSQQWSNSDSTDERRQGQRPIETMTKAEALEVLGLEAGAGRDDIITAHRKLMSKVHPDKGGSDFLAKTINHARKVLLDKD
ncbi:MAG: DnaJ domain-containing protein, partial [bacterium]